MLLKTDRPFFPYAALLLSVAIWGGLPTITRIALTKMSVLAFITMRFLFSSILLSPYFLDVIKKYKKVSFGYWLAFVVTITLMFYSQTWSVAHIPVSWYVVIFSITPVVMALCLRYQMKWQAVFGVFLVLVNLFLFLSSGHGVFQWSVFGLVAVLIGMLCWVAYTVLLHQFHSIYNDIQITALTCYIAAAVNFCIWMFQGSYSGFHLSVYSCVISASLGIILPLAFFSYSYAMRHQPKFSIFGQYLEPVFGLIIALMILGGALSIKQYIAFAFVLIGVFFVMQYSNPKEIHKLKLCRGEQTVF